MQLPKDTVGLLEGIATARSIHRFRPDPIPDGDLAAILYSATRAPSGSTPITATSSPGDRGRGSSHCMSATIDCAR